MSFMNGPAPYILKIHAYVIYKGPANATILTKSR